MNILAVDTALGACSVAILEDKTILAHRFVLMERGHAEALAPMVADAVHEAGVEFSRLDRLAVTTGPGTFTGQRVGLAFMRGLRLALDCPLIGITTLEAMAAAAEEETRANTIGVVQDARRGEVYGGLYSQSRAIVPVKLLAFDEMMKEFAASCPEHGTLAFAGTAQQKAADWFQEKGRAVQLSTVMQPDALHVARLAANRTGTEITVQALYLRPSDAKLGADAVRIRVAHVMDAELLARINAANLAEPWDAHFFARVLEGKGGLGLIAEARGVPTGFVLARTAADETEILAIAVSAPYRRNGIGRRLLREAAEGAVGSGSARLYLEVAVDNLAAQKLYESQGFRKAGRRKAYYSDGRDAAILQVPLPLMTAGLGNSPKVD